MYNVQFILQFDKLQFSRAAGNKLTPYSLYSLLPLLLILGPHHSVGKKWRTSKQGQSRRARSR